MKTKNKSQHTPKIITSIFYNMSLCDTEGDCVNLEAVAKELSIKHDPEITQEELADKVNDLVSAAPDLLAACEKALPYLKLNPALYHNTENAIAKAKGD